MNNVFQPYILLILSLFVIRQVLGILCACCLYYRLKEDDY